MSFLGLTKRKSVSSTSSTSPSSSLNGATAANATVNHKNTFKKFDEKKDYVRRCHMKKLCSSNGSKHPSPISFCLGKKY